VDRLDEVGVGRKVRTASRPSIRGPGPGALPGDAVILSSRSKVYYRKDTKLVLFAERCGTVRAERGPRR
jgi:hypothetical protein